MRRMALLAGVLALVSEACNNPPANPCGSSSLSGAMAFPVKGGLAFHDPDGGNWAVWLWDVFDAGGGNSDSLQDDWRSYCNGAQADGFNTTQHPPSRLLYLSIAPPLAGAHSQPEDAGTTALMGTFFEQGDLTGQSSSSGSFDATTTTTCLTGPLQLTFGGDGGAAGTMTGTVNVPLCSQ